VSGRRSFTSLCVGAGEDAEVRCITCPGEGPILSLDAGPVSVSLSVAGRTQMCSWGAEFARTLAREAQRFAEECERMHAAQAGSGAAAGDAG